MSARSAKFGVSIVGQPCYPANPRVNRGDCNGNRDPGIYYAQSHLRHQFARVRCLLTGRAALCTWKEKLDVVYSIGMKC